MPASDWDSTTEIDINEPVGQCFLGDSFYTVVHEEEVNVFRAFTDYPDMSWADIEAIEAEVTLWFADDGLFYKQTSVVDPTDTFSSSSFPEEVFPWVTEEGYDPWVDDFGDPIFVQPNEFLVDMSQYEQKWELITDVGEVSLLIDDTLYDNGGLNPPVTDALISPYVGGLALDEWVPLGEASTDSIRVWFPLFKGYEDLVNPNFLYLWLKVSLRKIDEPDVVKEGRIKITFIGSGDPEFLDPPTPPSPPSPPPAPPAPPPGTLPFTLIPVSDGDKHGYDYFGALGGMVAEKVPLVREERATLRQLYYEDQGGGSEVFVLQFATNTAEPRSFVTVEFGASQIPLEFEWVSTSRYNVTYQATSSAANFIACRDLMISTAGGANGQLLPVTFSVVEDASDLSMDYVVTPVLWNRSGWVTDNVIGAEVFPFRYGRIDFPGTTQNGTYVAGPWADLQGHPTVEHLYVSEAGSPPVGDPFVQLKVLSGGIQHDDPAIVSSSFRLESGAQSWLLPRFGGSGTFQLFKTEDPTIISQVRALLQGGIGGTVPISLEWVP